MLMQKFPLRKMFQPLIFYTRRLRKPWRTRRAEPLQGEFGCLRQFTVILHNAKKLELRKGLPSGGHFPVLLKRDKLNKMKLILLLLISCLALHSTKGKSTIKSTLCLFFFFTGIDVAVYFIGSGCWGNNKWTCLPSWQLKCFPGTSSHRKSLGIPGPSGVSDWQAKNRNCSTSLVYNSASAYCDYRKSLWLI